MLKVKMFITRWLYKITHSERWVHLYIDLLDEQIKEDIKEAYNELA